jgi:ketol-acid reductoisomerase
MNKELIIIGFGNQAKAWAQNLRDSNYTVKIFLRENSKSKGLVEKMGFNIVSKDQLKAFTKFALLTPDDTHVSIISELQDYIPNDSIFIYAHGFSLTYEKINDLYPQYNHVLLAPKAIASELRFQFECKGGLGGVYSFEYIETKK